jgi:serine/threonine-protein kinase
MVDPRPSGENQPEPDLSNRQIANYQIGRRLGRGGMADVYLAEQISLRRPIALKVLHRSLAGDASYVRRFHNEAQAAAALVHTNIVQIHEVGCADGIHFIAQEFVDGQNLKQWLSRRGPLDARQAISVMRQVAAALHKAGQRGIIHRDIKPENIMLTSAGEVKVADFGLARAAHDGSRVDLTQVGMTMGTPPIRVATSIPSALPVTRCWQGGRPLMRTTRLRLPFII